MFLSYLILTQTFVTLFLTGLIWTIQIVHYPSFLDVPISELQIFHKNHTNRISLLVIPLMTLELVVSIVLLFSCLFEQLESVLGSNSELMQDRVDYIHAVGFWVWLNLIIVVLLWGSTFFISVPIHNELSQGVSEPTIQKLIRTNWVRTILWSIKSYIVLRILVLFYENPRPFLNQ